MGRGAATSDMDLEQLDYEERRQKQIEENQRVMEELMGVAKAQFREATKVTNPSPSAQSRLSRKRHVPEWTNLPRRNSDRLKNNPPEAKYSDGVDDDNDFRRPAKKVKKLGKGLRNFDAGRRWQGGRLYDSDKGVTCHWCRQKTVERKVTCTNTECNGGGDRLRNSFCGGCLRNRHGEDVRQASKSGKWVCPKCRGSCGKGCTTCCNCGPCRKKAGLGPTGQLVHLAKSRGFDNVHDYLVNLNTGEGPEEIASRKCEFDWGDWLNEILEDNGATTSEDEYIKKQLKSDSSSEDDGKTEETEETEEKASGDGEMGLYVDAVCANDEDDDDDGNEESEKEEAADVVENMLRQRNLQQEKLGQVRSSTRQKIPTTKYEASAAKKPIAIATAVRMPETLTSHFRQTKSSDQRNAAKPVPEKAVNSGTAVGKAATCPEVSFSPQAKRKSTRQLSNKSRDLIGKSFWKEFPGFEGKFQGFVQSYDRQSKLYHIFYPIDQDREDMTEEEVHFLLKLSS